MSEGEGLSTVPPPLSLSEEVSPTQPVGGVYILPVHHGEPVLDQVMLLLADELCRVPMVGVAPDMASNQVMP